MDTDNKNIYLFLGSLSFLLAVIVFAWSYTYLRNLRAEINVARNGTETEAVVTDRHKEESDEWTKYYVEYTYQDENGVEYNGKTDTVYNAFNVPTIGSTIDIVYIKDRSVLADYNPEAKENNIPAIITATVVGVVVFISIGGIIIYLINQEHKKEKIKAAEKSTKTTGYFVSSHINDDGKKFNIEYRYQDEMGVWKRGYSDYIYSYGDAEFFQKLGQFEISVLGEESIITEGVNYLKLNDNKAVLHKKICENCGSIVDEGNTTCPNCGGQKLKPYVAKIENKKDSK